MKIIAKTKAVLISNKAETMVEVVIAFLVLSIVMALFAHGLQYASRAESYAIDNTKNYDGAMLELQKAIAGYTTDVKATNQKTEPVGLNGYDGNDLVVNMYSVPLEGDEYACYYWVFDVKSSTDEP